MIRPDLTRILQIVNPRKSIEFLRTDPRLQAMCKRARVWFLLLFGCFCFTAQAADARILKVLPHYMDHEGRISLSPSLYERDAYQDVLRHHPEQRSAMRFDINWKAKRARGQRPLLRIELRSSNGEASKPLVLEQAVRPHHVFSTWSSLVLKGEDYEKFGQLLAWRATLWQGTELLAEQKSFLW